MIEGVIINADDYAMDGGVDAAILKLSAEGVVTATSAMVLSPAWPRSWTPNPGKGARVRPWLWGISCQPPKRRRPP